MEVSPRAAPTAHEIATALTGGYWDPFEIANGLRRSLATVELALGAFLGSPR